MKDLQKDYFGTPIEEGDWTIRRQFGEVVISQATYRGSGCQLWNGGGARPINDTIVEDKAVTRLEDLYEHGIRVSPHLVDTVHVNTSNYDVHNAHSALGIAAKSRIEEVSYREADSLSPEDLIDAEMEIASRYVVE